MKNEDVEKFLLGSEEALKNVLKKFNETAPLLGGKGAVLVVARDGSLDGVISEGDVRRLILSGENLNVKVSEIIEKKCKYLMLDHSPHEALRLFEMGLEFIPVVDKSLRPIDILVRHNFTEAYKLPKIYRSRVPLRVSFAGGGTDMSYLMNEHDNAAVLTCSINRYCYATVIPRLDGEIHLLSKDLGLSYVAKNLVDICYDGKLDLIKAAVKTINPKFGFNLETYSEVEPGTGLGGSSALTAAVIGVFNYLSYDQGLDAYGIADLAYQAERMELHVSGGWQDQYATVFGGVNWIEFRKKDILVHPLKIRNDVLRELEYNLIFFKFGSQRTSHEIQASKAIFAKQNADKNASYMLQMSSIVIGMKESILRGKLKAFGDYLNDAWNLKKLMSPDSTNEKIEKIYKVARLNGALGGKVLGAGQGGYLMLYAAPLYHRNIVNALTEFGCIQEHLRFSDTGLEIWSTEK